MNYNISVPQGSSLGPTLWLLIINELLNTSRGRAYRLKAYADDVILMSATASFHFTNMSIEPIDTIIDWCNKYKLKLSISKCTYTMFKTGKRITHITRIKIGNGNLKFTKELKYLGLTFDMNLSWIPHINYLKAKIDNLIYKIRNTVRPTWELKPAIVKNIYKLVI